MSVSSGLHAGWIDCLISRLVNGVRWLGIFGRDELPDVTREIRPWCLILNTEPINQPGTHWLALYAPLDGNIELFDSIGFSPRLYSLDFLEVFHLYFLSHLALLFVVTTVLFISIYVLEIIHLVTMCICLIKFQVVTYG